MTNTQEIKSQTADFPLSTDHPGDSEQSAVGGTIKAKLKEYRLEEAKRVLGNFDALIKKTNLLLGESSDWPKSYLGNLGRTNVPSSGAPRTSVAS